MSCPFSNTTLNTAFTWRATTRTGFVTAGPDSCATEMHRALYDPA
jgi:hypothetical protein